MYGYVWHVRVWACTFVWDVCICFICENWLKLVIENISFILCVCEKYAVTFEGCYSRVFCSYALYITKKVLWFCFWCDMLVRFIYRYVCNQGRRRGAGGGGTSPPLSKVGGHKWVCAPPPLLGRANVLISLFAHILWLKTHFFQNFLGSLRSPTLINQYFLNFANLKL